ARLWQNLPNRSEVDFRRIRVAISLFAGEAEVWVTAVHHLDCPLHYRVRDLLPLRAPVNIVHDHLLLPLVGLRGYARPDRSAVERLDDSHVPPLALHPAVVLLEVLAVEAVLGEPYHLTCPLHCLAELGQEPLRLPPNHLGELFLPGFRVHVVLWLLGQGLVPA